MKYICKFLLCSILLGLLCCVCAAAAFSDVPASHWAYSDITAMERRGIVEGSNGQFRPSDPVSNQAFLAMVCRASGMDDRTLEARWTADPILAYGGYLRWFRSEELSNENKSEPISREFAAQLLVKAFFPQETQRRGSLPFSDYRKITSGRQQFVAIAVQRGLIGGYTDGTFCPQAPLTRAAAAALLNRTLQQLEQQTESEPVQVPILMYHDVSYLGSGYSKTPEQFRAQMQELKDAGFHTVTYQQLVDFVEKGAALPEKPIVITLDDGYRSNYEYAFPILQELDMKAEIALIGGAIQYTNWGLKWDDVREMKESGVISFQAHTHQMHEDASARGGRLGVLKAPGETWKLYVETLTADIQKNLNQIERESGIRPIAFTYPRGKWNYLAEGLVTQLGCKVTVTTKEGVACIRQGDPSSLHLMDRIGMDFRNGSVLKTLQQFGYRA